MQVIIQSVYRLRDKLITSYISYPQFSLEIEDKLSRELESLSKRNEPFTLEFKVEQK